jgi:hypothetical protein
MPPPPPHLIEDEAEDDEVHPTDTAFFLPSSERKFL